MMNRELIEAVLAGVTPGASGDDWLGVASPVSPVASRARGGSRPLPRGRRAELEAAREQRVKDFSKFVFGVENPTFQNLAPSNFGEVLSILDAVPPAGAAIKFAVKSPNFLRGLRNLPGELRDHWARHRLNSGAIGTVPRGLDPTPLRELTGKNWRQVYFDSLERGADGKIRFRDPNLDRAFRMDMRFPRGSIIRENLDELNINDLRGVDDFLGGRMGFNRHVSDWLARLFWKGDIQHNPLFRGPMGRKMDPRPSPYKPSLGVLFDNVVSSPVYALANALGVDPDDVASFTGEKFGDFMDSLAAAADEARAARNRRPIVTPINPSDASVRAWWQKPPVGDPAFRVLDEDEMLNLFERLNRRPGGSNLLEGFSHR